VLAGLNLVVPEGKTVVLLGSSGSGKSTLLRIVAGLEEADAGRVTLGTEVVADPRSRVPAEKRGVGLVFQDLELWPHLTVAENIAFGLHGRPRGRAARQHPRVVALAKRLGVDAHLARRPTTLSGGERQRVALARTLAPDPDVVLHDEALASLDPARRADLVGLLRELQREQPATVLHVTHDPAEALALADEIAVLSAGRVVDQGAPQALYDAPRTAAGARALGPVNLLAGTRDGGTWQTVLGRLVAAHTADQAATHVLVRPERVHAGSDGVEAVVESAWSRGNEWGFFATVGETRVEGRSTTPVDAGQRVRLLVRGAVAAVRSEAINEEAA
jgi:iron(III) transport system ATP-binding protein